MRNATSRAARWSSRLLDCGHGPPVRFSTRCAAGCRPRRLRQERRLGQLRHRRVHRSARREGVVWQGGGAPDGARGNADQAADSLGRGSGLARDGGGRQHWRLAGHGAGRGVETGAGGIWRAGCRLPQYRAGCPGVRRPDHSWTAALGRLAIGDTVVPLLGVRLDPAAIQNARCPIFPDSLR